MAAMVAYRSTHWDMFVMGKRVGRPSVGGVSPSMEISAISTNSRSRIFLTTLGDRVVAGLNGPVVRREVVEAEVVGMGSVTVAETFVAAAASISSPAPYGEKIGRLEIVADDVVQPAG